MLDDRRRELLAAIGIESYCLRASSEALRAGVAEAPAQTPGAEAGAQFEVAQPADQPDGAVRVRLAVAVARGTRGDARFTSLLAQVIRALGIGPAEVAWVEFAGDRAEAPLPEVDCYLMLGAAAARAGSAHLSLERQASATIAVSAEPAELFRDAAGRRALWQALKPLVHRLHNAC